ncbi:non-specific lipid-transfer protein-like protein [Tanacetum coccineum]
MTILLITMATHYGGVMAQFTGCATVITSMPSCASFIAGSTLTAPPGCCTEFESVIQSQPKCLCQVFKTTASFMGLSGLPKLLQATLLLQEQHLLQASLLPEKLSSTNATSPSANSPPPSDATSTRYTTFPVLCLLLVAAYAMVF